MEEVERDRHLYLVTTRVLELWQMRSLRWTENPKDWDRYPEAPQKFKYYENKTFKH